MWARQSPDRCDKCEGCNDARAVVVRRKLSRMVVIEAGFGGPLGLSDAVFLCRSKNGSERVLVWSFL